MKVLLSLGLSGICFLAAAQCDPNAVFSNTTSNAVCEEVDGAVRYFYSNSLPDHSTGTFPNTGNPHTISAQQLSLTMCAFPQTNSQLTYLDQGSGQCPYWEFGIASNGLILDPIAAEYFENPNTGQLNRDWNLNALSSNNNLGLDFNDAHVQPSGKYHYHGFPSSLESTFGISAGSHSPLVGYAADGYPIYGKYVYSDPNDASSAIVELNSSYQLKSGTRPGNGVTAPDGPYDGTYTQDYEYVSGLGDLDECNGRTAVTPEFPNGTYYYVLTTDFPVIPRCLVGNADMAFTIGPTSMGCATSNANSICSITGFGHSMFLDDHVQVYPNPVQDLIRFSSDLDIRSVKVFGASGKELLMSDDFENGIDIGTLPAGNYYVQFIGEGASVTKTIYKD